MGGELFGETTPHMVLFQAPERLNKHPPRAWQWTQAGPARESASGREPRDLPTKVSFHIKGSYTIVEQLRVRTDPFPSSA